MELRLVLDIFKFCIFW